MSVFALIPSALRPWLIALVLAAITVGSAASAWTVQDWRYGRALAEQAKAGLDAALATLTTEQDKRVALERRLHLNDETHYKELSDAKNAQQRLSDRLWFRACGLSGSWGIVAGQRLSTPDLEIALLSING